ncbi:MAG TPA: protein kinase [Holophaga sp.]|nr:protein kinase [Holophaga sp.]
MTLPSKIGKYQILRQLGKGSMGEVFLGQDPLLGRQVAIKTIQAGTSFGTEARLRFEREAKATAALNHPNIVTVYEFGEDAGLHYLVMEYVEGEDLDGLIRKGERSKADLLEALAQTCEGLAYAHERGIIHRDLKPGNVLVSIRGKRIQAKLTDFGVALVDRSTLTEQDVRMGTVSYMAPEYLDTGKASISTDLFAIGVVLYEILSGGRRPFAADTPTGTLNAILRSPAAPLDLEQIRDLPQAIVELSQKALAKDPSERFPDAEALATAIREAMEAPATTGSGAHALPKGQPLIVGKGGNCLSIRVALRQAIAGSAIRLLPGIYREAITIDKPVTLIGDGPAGDIILECPEDGQIRAQADRITLENLEIRRTGHRDAALIEVRKGVLTLRGVKLQTDSGPAIQVDQGSELRIAQGFLRGGSEGLRLKPGAHAEVQDCELTGQATALRLEGGSELSLTRARIHDVSGLGLQLGPGCQATLEDCELDALAGGGAELEADARMKLRRCHVRASGPVGVLVLEKAQAVLEDCEITGHRDSGVHIAAGATAQLRQCRIHHNAGYGLSLLGSGLASAVECEFSANEASGVLIHQGATAQLKGCHLLNGLGVGIECADHGQGVLEGCEIAGNAQTGARVEPGGSLLLVRCTLRDSRETGLMLFENAEVTLEECVIHRNARGGILLAKDASDPVLRGGNQLEDDLFRSDARGNLVKIAPLRRS